MKTTDSNHRHPIAPDRLGRDFTADGPNQAWASDMTYIATDEGWLELVRHEHYRNHAEARASLFDYIEAFYNRQRIHSTLGYLSPDEFERACSTAA